MLEGMTGFTRVVVVLNIIVVLSGSFRLSSSSCVGRVGSVG